MYLIDIAAGTALLLLGRKLFWLFIAIVGFYVGFEVARIVFADQPQWLVWLIAIGAGLIGAVLAMFFERVAFALAGFYAGGYVALVIVERLAPGSMSVAWPFFIGGVVGALCAAFIMDWAIIVLSSLVGAALIVSALGLGDLVSVVIYAGLLAAGVVVQALLMRPPEPPRPQKP
jgi:hypothetical protein